MSNISQSGDYRGLVLDRGISKSSGGHEQLTLSLQAIEKYDPDNGVWSPFEYEDCEAQARLNLITSKEVGNMVNLRQVMRAFGWDGVSFSALNNPDVPLAKQIQWHMGAETYEGVERIKVQSIGTYDAPPGRQVEKLDPAAVRAIDAKYANVLKALGGGPKPKSAKPTVPPLQDNPLARGTAPAPQAPVSPDPTPAAVSPTAVTTVTTALAAPMAEPPKKRGRPTKSAVPTTPPPTAAPVTPELAPMTQEEAWNIYVAKVEGKKTDLEVSNTWTATVKEKYGSDEAVGEDWSGVYAECCARLGV